ncbi:MAG: hypothetical protein ACT4ON_08760 [Bacteroidota bacterium]
MSKDTNMGTLSPVNMLHSKRFILIYYLILLGTACGNIGSSSSENAPIYYREQNKTINNINYFIITPVEAHIDFELTRPPKNDQNILLCVPGAYTDLKTYGVDGLHICKGKVFNKDHINYTLGGGVKIINDKVEIFPTGYGKLLNDSLLKTITDQNGIFFQQTQCIINGIAEKFRDTKLFQRRGIITLKTGGYAIVESEQPITLRQFSDDMVMFGAKDLLNFDMGSWDEGWYRNPSTNKTTVLGQSLAQTAKQTNWVVLKKN